MEKKRQVNTKKKRRRGKHIHMGLGGMTEPPTNRV